MPLFGSKNKNGDNTTGNSTGVDRHHIMNANNLAMTDYTTSATNGVSTTPGNAMNVSHVGGQQRDYAAPNTLPPRHHVSDRLRRLSNTDPASVGATNNDTTGPTYSSGTYDTGIPPTGAVNHGQSTSIRGTGHRLTGKAESAIGSMVGSNALKTKGLEKEKEANLLKLRGRELAEAERLEREALMRRERAVAHGAHPSDSALGAGRAGTGVTGSFGPGAGF